MASTTGLVISKLDDVTVVSFGSRAILDIAAVEAIGKELYALVDEQARRKLLLDFEKVKFLSSTMIGILTNLHRKIEAIKGKVVIVGLKEELHRVFNIMKLDKVLHFAVDEAEALHQFGVFMDG